MSRICELNNATHLEYDIDLTTDAVFYYRGSKVSYYSNLLACRLTLQLKQLLQWLQRVLEISFVQSYVFSNSFVHTVRWFFLYFIFLLSFRMPVLRIHSAKMMQLVSPVSQSRDIDTCALLDSRENIVKKVDFITWLKYPTLYWYSNFSMLFTSLCRVTFFTGECLSCPLKTDICNLFGMVFVLRSHCTEVSFESELTSDTIQWHQCPDWSKTYRLKQR